MIATADEDDALLASCPRSRKTRSLNTALPPIQVITQSFRILRVSISILCIGPAPASMCISISTLQPSTLARARPSRPKIASVQCVRGGEGEDPAHAHGRRMSNADCRIYIIGAWGIIGRAVPDGLDPAATGCGAPPAHIWDACASKKSIFIFIFKSIASHRCPIRMRARRLYLYPWGIAPPMMMMQSRRGALPAHH
ncbi:hypothetical protein C8R44DRAFT_884929 [Mycena epipterygia]|nr:hypothetical protein C8R44DRAFT_884929 [Mycena epipterygia]